MFSCPNCAGFQKSPWIKLATEAVARSGHQDPWCFFVHKDSTLCTAARIIVHRCRRKSRCINTSHSLDCRVFEQCDECSVEAASIQARQRKRIGTQFEGDPQR